MKTSLPKFLLLKITLSLAFLILLSSCSVRKIEVPRSVMPPPEPLTEVFKCGFGLYSFSGVLLCFGNDCAETDPTVTTLDFQSDRKAVKTLTLNDGVKKVSEGVWALTENCDIEIVYQDEHKEFYRYHPKIYRLELLNSNRESYKGTLALLTTINQIN